MKPRILLSAAVAAGLVLGVSGAEAAPKTLDGKKTKTLSFTAVGVPQTNDVAAMQSDLDGLERVNCVMPVCAHMDFVYRPAKGVKPVGLAFESTWTAPVGADIDLYVAALDKRGDPMQMASCGASVGNRERIYLPASSFRVGKTYRVVAYFYRTVNETVTTKVTFNGKNEIPATAPAELEDNVAPVNCGL